MTPYQRGAADFGAGVDRFANPFPMGSADWSSWRNGWNAAQTAAVLARAPARPTYHNNLNLGGR